MAILDDDILITLKETIKDALKKLSRSGKKVLLVTNAERILLGTISDGDIRRALLNNKGLDESINGVFNKKPIVMLKEEFTIEGARKILLEQLIELLPIVDAHDKILNYVTWDEVFADSPVEFPAAQKIDVPLVIMAGGKGTRLEPFTKILPKPLIPIGDKPIIEIIIDEFKRHGIHNFYVALGHKGELIESFFQGIKKDYTINFIREPEELGTAGGLKLIERLIHETFIVSNCDVIVKADFQDVINNHMKNQAMITVLSSIQHYKIPYGVVQFKEEGQISNIVEKPEYTFTINTGVYVLNREALKYIPKDASFHMTDLVRTLIENKKKIYIYPVNENAYLDIGQWEEYKKTVQKLQF